MLPSLCSCISNASRLLPVMKLRSLRRLLRSVMMSSPLNSSNGGQARKRGSRGDSGRRNAFWSMNRRPLSGERSMAIAWGGDQIAAEPMMG